MDEKKLAWLKSIGAGEFPEPVKYIYTFPEYKGAFNLSERYLEETSLEELKAQYQKNKTYAEEIVKFGKSQEDLVDERLKNWISVNLPENCPNVCISFEREIAEMQIKQFEASPLYGFDREENWLPIKIFITYGGILAPNQRRLEV